MFFLPNIKHKLFNKIKHKIYQKPNIFNELNDHCKGQQLFNTHRDQIISFAILTYLNIRFHHADASIEKKSISMRKKFSKNVKFNTICVNCKYLMTLVFFII